MFKVECCGRTDSTVNKNVRHIFYFKVTFRKSSCLGEASHHQHTPGVFTIDALTDSCCVQSCANFCWHWLKPLAEAVVLFFLRRLLCYSVRPLRVDDAKPRCKFALRQMFYLPPSFTWEWKRTGGERSPLLISCMCDFS